MASRVYFALLLSLMVTIAIATAADQEEQKLQEEHVLTLDHSNFTDTIKKHDFIVVEFYAPWCGHCIKLAPEYEKAASVLSSLDPPLVLAKVDADDESNKEISKEYGVGGFPTIKIIRNGGKSVQDYKGPREADGIVTYVKKQSGPSSVEIKSKEDASNLIDQSIALVGVFPEFSGEEFKNFTAMAEKLRSEYDFGHTLDAKLLPHGEPASGPFIRLFKPFDELFADFQDFHEEAVEKFIETSTVPILTMYDKDPVNQRLAGKFFRTPNSKAMLWMNFSDEVADSLKSKYREVAEKYNGEGISFLLGDTELVGHAADYFGVKNEQIPFIIVQSNDGNKYVKTNVEPNLIADWVKQYKDGQVPPYVKSEPIPETNNEPVKVVVRDSLQDMVFNSEKNVLLEFYAPWCGHCKALAPVLEEIAVSYQQDPDILIAKLDATANDVPSTFEVEGFPTLYFKSTSGKLVQFDGERTKDGIIDFIEKNREKTSKKDLPKDEL